jgi:hypothetical protein
MSLPPGFRTLLISLTAAVTPGIVHIVKVVSTVSTALFSRGRLSPGRSRNVTSIGVRARSCWASRRMPGFGSRARIFVVRVGS